MKRTAYISLFAATALLASGCQSELQPQGGGSGSDGTVCFQPVLDAVRHELDSASPATKATTLVSADGSISVPLWCVVSDGIAGQACNDENGLCSELDSASPATKGEQKNTSGSWNALDDYGFTEFQVAAWKGGSAFIPTAGSGNDYETVSQGTGLWSTANTYKWDALTPITFYAYANLPENQTGVVEADITCTGSDGQTLIYTVVPTDATEQNDILMGYYSGKARYDATLRRGGIADVKFYHPLTAVRFVKGDFENADGTPATVSFKSISLEGVYAAGTTELIPASIVAEDCGDKFAWNTSGCGVKTVTLAAAEGSSLEVSSDNVIGEPFIIIPQTVTPAAPVTIKVVVETGGSTQTLKAMINSASWKAGKTNTYTISKMAPSTYHFTFDGHSKVSATRNFNEITEEEEAFEVYSTRSITSETADWSWNIKSYQVGTDDPVKVNADSFTYSFTGGAIEVGKFNDGGVEKLKVISSARGSVDRGGNPYWTNEAGRTDNLDWSPEDWTSATASSPIDLSKFNYQTDTPDAFQMNTANTYIIRHAGTYRIPLVYGNAIVNGAANPQSYYPNCNGDVTDGDVRTTGSEGENFNNTKNYRLVHFVNHSGNAITSPFIENNGADCIPTGCAVVWQDRAQVVKSSSLEIISGASAGTAGSYDVSSVRYLKFTVDKDMVCQNNAIICIYKDLDGDNAYDEGEAIWSWQIWTTNDPMLLDDPVAVTYNSNTYKFFPVYHLGWLEQAMYLGNELKVVLVQKTSGKEIELTVNQKEVQTARRRGTLYQWGRKDPDPSTSDTISGFKTANMLESGNIEAGIANPGTFYKYSTNDRTWTGSDVNTALYCNLWSGKKSMIGKFDQDGTVTKTIYDPSPVGYQMPAPGAFNITQDKTKKDGLFIYRDDANSIKGWNIYYTDSGQSGTIIFPIAGMRQYSGGFGWDNVGGEDGHFYTASAYDGTAKTTSGDYKWYGPVMYGGASLFPGLGSGNPGLRGHYARPVIDTTMPNNPMQ